MTTGKNGGSDFATLEPGALAEVATKLRNIAAMTRRNPVHIVREPIVGSGLSARLSRVPGKAACVDRA